MTNLPYTVYGLRLKSEKTYRYVGMTTGKPKNRLTGHLHSALAANSKLAVHCWIRKYGRSEITMEVLETCDNRDFAYLNYAERYWIKSLREFGHPLLNHTDGGGGRLGSTAWNKGIPMTDEQKERMRLVNLGKVLPEDHKELISRGVKAHFEKNGQKSVYDYWVDKHGTAEADRLWEDHRAKKSVAMSGSGNHMFGKTGQDATCYGRVGDKHPMYGTHHSEEAKARISRATKGRPKSEATKLRMSYAQHIRSHGSKIKTTCQWCCGADLQNELQKRENELNGSKVE